MLICWDAPPCSNTVTTSSSGANPSTTLPPLPLPLLPAFQTIRSSFKPTHSNNYASEMVTIPPISNLLLYWRTMFLWINLSFINCFYCKQHCHFNGEMYLFLVPKEHNQWIGYYFSLHVSLSQCYCSDYYNYDNVIMITSINPLLVSKQSLD